MSLFLEHQYLLRVSTQFEKFVKKSDGLYCFRCPLCGDGEHGKARGYIYRNPKGQGYIYKCHNCGASMSFPKFLELVEPYTYREFQFELLREKRESSLKFIEEKKEAKKFDFFKTSKPSILKDNPNTKYLRGLIRLDTLPDNHPCKEYVKSRKIPESMFKELYFCKKFKEYINTLIPNKFTNVKYDEERLVIPFFDENGTMYALQGRALDPKNPIRYFTIKLDEDKTKLYGLNRVDPSKEILMVEGPIDSLFLPNCIAMSGASVKDDWLTKHKSRITVVFDNEPRNRELCKQMRHIIDDGFKICLWEDGLPFKDINEAILGGYSKEDLINIIHRNTYQGLKAKIKFGLWTKY